MTNSVGRPRYRVNESMAIRLRELIVTYGAGARLATRFLVSEGFNPPHYTTVHKIVKEIEQQLIAEGYTYIEIGNRRFWQSRQIN